MAAVAVKDGVVTGLEDGATLSLKGENGVLFDQDVPKSGTPQREVFEYLISTGRVSVLGDAAAPKKASAAKKAAGSTEGDEA